MLHSTVKTYIFSFVKEFSVEAGRPDTITEERLKVFKNQEVLVLVEEVIDTQDDSTEGLAIGRSWFQAPEVDGCVVIRYEKDFESDIIKLTSGTGGQGTLNNEPFYYAYELNDNVKPNIQKAFRDALKHKMTDKHVFFSEQAFDFVECGIGRMYSMRSMDDFSLVISTATHYGEKTLAGLMCVYIWDTVKSTVETYDKFHLELFKKHCQEVTFDEERALYGSDGVRVENCCFEGPADGESALKESKNVEVADCHFALRYPFWHDQGLRMTGSEMTPLCRAALWTGL